MQLTMKITFDSLSDEEEDYFMADKKDIIKLKKCVVFTPNSPPRVLKPLIQNEAEPGRVPWAVELVNILYLMPGTAVFGHLLLVEKVDSIAHAFDNVEPIKYKDMFEVPLTFEQAWNHPCPWQHQHWRAAILLEPAKMKKMCVWKKVKCSVIPRGRVVTNASSVNGCLILNKIIFSVCVFVPVDIHKSQVLIFRMHIVQSSMMPLFVLFCSSNSYSNLRPNSQILKSLFSMVILMKRSK
jgi:hypothetical protein